MATGIWGTEPHSKPNVQGGTKKEKPIITLGFFSLLMSPHHTFIKI